MDKNQIKYAVALPTIKQGLSGGGHMHMLRFAEAMNEVSETILVSYNKKEEGYLFLEDDWQKLKDQGYVLVLSWGGSVNPIIQKYGKSLRMVYFMKGQDFGDRIPLHIPVISNCQYLLSQAQLHWPNNAQLYLPESLETTCTNTNSERDLDVLIVARKQSTYVLKTLIPALEKGPLKVHIQTDYIAAKELYKLYNRAKVYVYAFAPMRTDFHETGYRWMEGSATQTLEAMACGCTVLSNFRGGMVDFLEPPLIGGKIECVDLDWDLLQIQQAVQRFNTEKSNLQSEKIAERYGFDKYQERLKAVHLYLQDYFEFLQTRTLDSVVFQTPKSLGWVKKIQNRMYRIKRKWRS